MTFQASRAVRRHAVGDGLSCRWWSHTSTSSSAAVSERARRKQCCNLCDPAPLKATPRGIRRTMGAAPTRKAPVLAETARAMVFAAPAGLKGLRDRALHLAGFGGAFRRSELVALDVADLEETEDGLRVTIRRSKTDQRGRGVTIAIIRGGARSKPLRHGSMRPGPRKGRSSARSAKAAKPRMLGWRPRASAISRRAMLAASASRARPMARTRCGRFPDQRRPPRRVGVQNA